MARPNSIMKVWFLYFLLLSMVALNHATKNDEYDDYGDYSKLIRWPQYKPKVENHDHPNLR
ncbi:hypothetical protein CR513_50725, partial [Mucuna pruriens]